eukprot:scaffold22137_cov127-Isochrysis_galbana.AAC.1
MRLVAVACKLPPPIAITEGGQISRSYPPANGEVGRRRWDARSAAARGSPKRQSAGVWVHGVAACCCT